SHAGARYTIEEFSCGTGAALESTTTSKWIAPSPRFSAYARLRSEKWISDSHRAISTPVLEILGEKFGQAIMLRVGPEMCVVPVKFISRHAHHRDPKHFLIRIEYGEFI